VVGANAWCAVVLGRTLAHASDARPDDVTQELLRVDEVWNELARFGTCLPAEDAPREQQQGLANVLDAEVGKPDLPKVGASLQDPPA
jgi:hypothetical protein